MESTSGQGCVNDVQSQEAPTTLACVAAALSEALAALRDAFGRPLDRYEIFAAMRDLAGSRNWDAMPVAQSVGAERLMWTGPDVPAGSVKHLLVTPLGQCYIEGELPTDPVRAMEYVAIRRRYLHAHPQGDPPPAGALEALRSQAAYEALTNRIAEGLAELIPPADDDGQTRH